MNNGFLKIIILITILLLSCGCAKAVAKGAKETAKYEYSQNIESQDPLTSFFNSIKIYLLTEISGNEPNLIGKTIKISSKITKKITCKVENNTPKLFDKCEVNYIFDENPTKIGSIKQKKVESFPKSSCRCVRAELENSAYCQGFTENLNYTLKGKIILDSNYNYIFEIEDSDTGLFPVSNCENNCIENPNKIIGKLLFETIKNDQEINKSQIILKKNSVVHAKPVNNAFNNLEKNNPTSLKNIYHEICILSVNTKNNEFANRSGHSTAYLGEKDVKINITLYCNNLKEIEEKISEIQNSNELTERQLDFCEEFKYAKKNEETYCLLILEENKND